MPDSANLASSLAVILSEDQATSDKELKRTLAANRSLEEKVNDDSTFAREKLYEMMERNSEAVDLLLKITKESMSARHGEVLALLIQTNVKTAEGLLKLHADKQIVQNNAINLERNRTGKTTNGTVNIDKAVFVGTTNDLLDMVKSTQKNQAITIEAREVDSEDTK